MSEAARFALEALRENPCLACSGFSRPLTFLGLWPPFPSAKPAAELLKREIFKPASYTSASLSESPHLKRITLTKTLLSCKVTSSRVSETFRTSQDVDIFGEPSFYLLHLISLRESRWVNPTRQCGGIDSFSKR